MASQTVHFLVNNKLPLQDVVIKDASGNILTDCSVTPNIGDPTVVGWNGPFGMPQALKPGQTTFSLTFTNASGSLTINAAGDVQPNDDPTKGPDILVVDAAAPASGSWKYGAPF